jgi:hypothetical protein
MAFHSWDGGCMRWDPKLDRVQLPKVWRMRDDDMLPRLAPKSAPVGLHFWLGDYSDRTSQGDALQS